MANEKNKETIKDYIKQGAKIGALGGAGIQLLATPFLSESKKILNNPKRSLTAKAIFLATSVGGNAALGAGIGALGGALAYQFKGD